MRAVVVLVCVIAVASLLYVLLSAWIASRARRRAGVWRVDTVTRPGGALAVVLERDGSQHERTVRELPAGIDGVELASELRLALEEARMQAEELNRLQ